MQVRSSSTLSRMIGGTGRPGSAGSGSIVLGADEDSDRVSVLYEFFLHKEDRDY